jgi:hypothetical protein
MGRNPLNTRLDLAVPVGGQVVGRDATGPDGALVARGTGLASLILAGDHFVPVGGASR